MTLRQLSLVGLCTVGVLVSGLLLDGHVRGRAEGLLARACGQILGSGCDAVLSSRWSVFPPLSAGPDEGEEQKRERGGRVPVAMLGLVYFASLLTWFLLAGPLERCGWASVIPIGILGAGSLVSLAMLAVMATVLRTWCPFCLAVHGVNFALAGLVFHRWRTVSRSAPPDTLVVYRGESARAWSAVVAIAAVCLAIWQATQAASLRRETASLRAALSKIEAETDVLGWLFEKQQRQAIPLRADDPQTPAVENAFTVVVFTDLQCPHCRRYEDRLLGEIAPLFGGRLRIVFKHFPLSRECNPRIDRDLHPDSCQAAYLAEAARAIKGSRGFLEMKAVIREVPAPWSQDDLNTMAGLLRLDAQRLESLRNDDAIKARVREDVELGYQLGVNSTPTVFFEGRRLDRNLRESLAFWKMLARPATRSDLPAADGDGA